MTIKRAQKQRTRSSHRQASHLLLLLVIAASRTYLLGCGDSSAGTPVTEPSSANSAPHA